MKTILLVDDATRIREDLGSALERKGLKVKRASTGSEAISIYREEKTDAVFLDIHLPDINGLNVFERLKEIDPEVKVYIITGKDNSQFEAHAARLGAKRYILKPVFLNDMMEIIEEI